MFFSLKSIKTGSSGKWRISERVAVRVVAILTAAMGLVNLVSGLTSSLATRIRFLDRISPLEVRHGSHLAASLAGFALLLLASGLWRRKRAAWLLTLAMLVVSIASHLLKGLDYEEAFLAGLLALILLAQRSHFYARSDPPSIRQGLYSMAAALLFTLVYGVAGFYLLDHHFKVNFGLWAALRQTIVMFTQFYDPGLQPVTGFGRYFAGSIYAVGALTISYALWMLARPVILRRPASPRERQHARSIIEAYGRSSLARLAWMDDKAYFFSEGGSVVAYVPKGRIALALGDPIGPPEDLPAAVASFGDFCEHNDWQAAFYQTPPDTLEIYRAAGYDCLGIGQEAIVRVNEFSLQGRTNKDLRYAYNRLEKLGYHAQVIAPPVSEEMLSQLRSISDDWLKHMHGSEKRFALGWFDSDYLSSVPLLLVSSPEGAVVAFASLLPEYRRNGTAIDLMRHRRDALSGTMDFLIVSLLLWAREQEVETVSLGLSALWGIGENEASPAVEKALHFIYEHIDRFYNFRGLHEFKEKFHPEWSPRYLIYPGLSSLPAVALAMARADSGDALATYLAK